MLVSAIRLAVLLMKLPGCTAGWWMGRHCALTKCREAAEVGSTHAVHRCSRPACVHRCSSPACVHRCSRPARVPQQWVLQGDTARAPAHCRLMPPLRESFHSLVASCGSMCSVYRAAKVDAARAVRASEGRPHVASQHVGGLQTATYRQCLYSSPMEGHGHHIRLASDGFTRGVRISLSPACCPACKDDVQASKAPA
jgi:hypothetical protein